MAHLKYETLLNYVDGRLSVEEKSQADTHLAGACEQCQRRLNLLQLVLRAAAGDKTIAPSASVLTRAVDISRTNTRGTVQPSLRTRLIAALNFDSHRQLSSALTRGAARERQMLYTAEGVDIDVKIKSERGDHNLIGQVLGQRQSGDTASAFVSLQRDTGQLLRAAETDSQGYFTFRGISPGVYELIFDLENQEVAVMGIEVGND